MQFESSKSSGHLAATKLIYSGPCFLTGVQVYSNGTNAATVTVYDASTAETIGKVMFKAIATGGATSNSFETMAWTFPVECENGIYVVLAGTTPGFVVEYIEA